MWFTIILCHFQGWLTCGFFFQPYAWFGLYFKNLTKQNLDLTQFSCPSTYTIGIGRYFWKLFGVLPPTTSVLCEIVISPSLPNCLHIITYLLRKLFSGSTWNAVHTIITHSSLWEETKCIVWSNIMGFSQQCWPWIQVRILTWPSVADSDCHELLLVCEGPVSGRLTAKKNELKVAENILRAGLGSEPGRHLFGLAVLLFSCVETHLFIIYYWCMKTNM